MVQIFANYNYEKFSLNKKMIQKFITDMIARHAPVNHHSELAWSLFLAKTLHIKLSAKQIEPIYQTNCSICALLTLDLEKMGLITGAVNKKIWGQFLTSDNLYSDMWLLAYEAYIKGWISPKDKKFVSNDQFFKTLEELHVSFYDDKKNVQLLRQNKKKATNKTKAKPSKKLKSANVEDYFDDLTIGDDFEDDFYEY